MAEKRVYEVVFILDTDTAEDDATRLIDGLQHTVTDQGGTITKSESMGRRQLAYRIGRKTEGNFMLFEVEGTGREIAELERRMRVSDAVIRYLTVRVDEDRRRADKLKERRARKASRRNTGGGRSSGGGGQQRAATSSSSGPAVATATPAAPAAGGEGGAA
ncbi:MAG: 30S ribosomal protein S6 [Pyrinomonadaceae bacterium]